MSTPPRVKMTVGLFRPFGGGAERQAERLGLALQRKGAEVEVLTLRPRGVAAAFPDDALPVRRLAAPGFGWLKAYWFARVVRRALEAYGPDRVDVIHAHQALLPAWAGVRAGETLRRPCIVKIGNTGARFDLAMMGRLYPFSRFAARHLAERATRFIAMTPAIRDDLHAWGVPDGRIVSIPNGVAPGEPITPHERAAARARLRIDPAARVILTVGTLTPKKNQASLLEALRRWPPESRPLLVVVGEGALLPKLQHESAELGVADAVVFTGRVQESAVRDHLAAADVFALPSLTEGISNALLEAMAAGLPVAVSDIPGNRAVIEDDATGMIVPVGDAEALHAALARVLGDTGLGRSLGAAARARIESAFAIDTVAQRYLDLYRQLCDEYGSA